MTGICIRCKNEIDYSIPHKDAKFYGGVTVFTCEHCGKLHISTRKIKMRAVPDSLLPIRKGDFYGKRIISNLEYYRNRKHE